MMCSKEEDLGRFAGLGTKPGKWQCFVFEERRTDSGFIPIKMKVV